MWYNTRDTSLYRFVCTSKQLKLFTEYCFMYFAWSDTIFEGPGIMRSPSETEIIELGSNLWLFGRKLNIITPVIIDKTS